MKRQFTILLIFKEKSAKIHYPVNNFFHVGREEWTRSCNGTL
jgi:hypothetical protein